MATAQEMLDKYLAAEIAILAGQSVEFDGRKLTRANLAEIQRGRAYWERRANARGSRPRHLLADFSK